MAVRMQAGIPWLARGWPDPPKPKPAEMIRHAFPLRPGTLYSRAYLELPEDLTVADADRLSQFLRALARRPTPRRESENAIVVKAIERELATDE